MITKLLMILALVEPIVGKRILGFFPQDGRSQHHIFATILYGLARQGHKVVYLTPVKPDVSHPNLDVRLKPSFIKHYKESWDWYWFTDAPVAISAYGLSNGAMELSEHMYGDSVTQEVIHSNDSYDAVLMESCLFQEPVSALIHKYGCVAIEVSTLGDSAWINEIAGLPDNPSYQIDYKTPLTDSMSFFERLYNSYLTWTTVLVGYYHIWRMQSVMDKYFNYTGWETRPPLNELVSNKSLILVYRDIALDYPYPLASHMRDIGGVNILPKKPLPKDLQDFMDTATEGVIFFSLGTHLQTSKLMSSDIGRAFVNVFRRLPQRILMKWEIDQTIDLPPNFKTYKWIPQHSVLAHKNCVLFITHGGLLSLTEAVFHAVPVIGIPHFFDQPKNMMHVARSGYGIQLTLGNITQKSASWAIHEVLTNPRYKEEVIKRSKILKDKRQNALDEAVYWVEYAMKYPNVLTPKAAFLNFFQLHMIDIKLFWILLIFLMSKVLRKTITIVISILLKRKKQKLQ